MDESKAKFPDGTRVKLRDGVDSTFYAGMAKVGCEGWVTRHRQDRFGLPEVYIQWDQTHWAYNRQPDCWTFEDHFEFVKGQTPMTTPLTPGSNPEGMSDEDARFMSMMRKLWDEVKANPDPDIPTPEDEAYEEHYQEAVQIGTDFLEGSEGFAVLAVRPGPEGLMVSFISEAKSPDAEILLGVHLSALGAKFHQDFATMHLALMSDEDEEMPPGFDAPHGV